MATYYWVGGTGTWDASDTTNWSASSGGAGGAGAPNNTDTVIFDAASGTGTCTTASGSACATATFDSATLNLLFGANHTMSGIFTLTSGSLDLGSFTLTCLRFSSSNTNTRSVAFGTGDITLTGNNAAIWNTATVTGFTYTGTPTVNCTYSGSTGSRTLSGGNIATGGGTEFNCVSFNITAGTDTIVLSSSNGVKNINFTGFAGTRTNTSATIFGNCTFSTGMTLTAGANALTFGATSGIQLITTNGKTLDFPITQNGIGGTVQLQDNLTMGSTRTYTLTAGDLHINNRTLSTGLFNSNNSNTRIIDFKSGNITVTGNAGGVWDCRTATNLSILGTPIVNCTYAGSTGTRIFRHGDTAGGSETNAISVKVIAGTDAVSFTSQAFIKDADFTGYSGAMTPTFNLYGNLTFSATQTISAGNTGLTIAGTSGTQQITMNGLTYDRNIVFNGVGGTFAFQDAFTQGSTKTFTLTNGTVRLKNGVTSTVGSFVANNSSVKFLQSTTPGSQATLSQAAGTVNVVDLTIRDINAVGGASWNAYTDFENTDAGNNDGWNFSLSPPYSTAELPVTLRPFTQPRRF